MKAPSDENNWFKRMYAVCAIENTARTVVDSKPPPHGRMHMEWGRHVWGGKVVRERVEVLGRCSDTSLLPDLSSHLSGRER